MVGTVCSHHQGPTVCHQGEWFGSPARVVTASPIRSRGAVDALPTSESPPPNVSQTTFVLSLLLCVPSRNCLELFSQALPESRVPAPSLRQDAPRVLTSPLVHHRTSFASVYPYSRLPRLPPLQDLSSELFCAQVSQVPLLLFGALQKLHVETKISEHLQKMTIPCESLHCAVY